jgi:hypothetical protein
LNSTSPTKAIFDIAEGDGVAVVQPAIGQAILRVGKARVLRVAAEPFEQEQIVLVRTFDGNAQITRQLRSTARVIEMAVGEQDLFECHALRRHGLLETFDLPAGIDDRRPAGARTPHQ